MLMDSNKHVNPLMAGILNSFAAAPKAPQCECDGDGSYCCPVHDDCQSCGERKGVALDPSFKTNDWYRQVGYKRAMWFCQECLDAQCSTCGNESAECKCVAVRYI